MRCLFALLAGLWLALFSVGAGAAAPVFVLNSLDASISVIEPRAGGGWQERERLATGKEPHHLYLAPDDKVLMVGNSRGDSITLLDPATGAVLRTVSGIADPYHLRFSPDMRWLVVAGNRLNHVDLYRWQGAQAEQPLELVKRLPAPRTPSHIWIDDASRIAYITLQDSDELLAVDLPTQRPLWKQAVGRTPADVYLSPDGRHLLVALTGERFVQIWALQGEAAPRYAGRFHTGAGAHSFRSLGDGRHVLVSNRAANTISKLDLVDWRIAAEYPAPGGPDDMDVLSDGRTLLVTSRWAKKLTVIDMPTRRVTQQLRVGRSPHGVWTLDHLPPPMSGLLVALSLAASCGQPVYLTLDTGHMGVAPLVAEVLQRQQVPASFFIAAEPTLSGGHSLDETWAPWWRARAAEGAVVGSHTWSHFIWVADLPGGRLRLRDRKGRRVELDAAQYCAELRRPAERWQAMTGKTLAPLFRAPGGKTSPNLLAAAKACGYTHVGWTAAGFLGDELPSERYPNAQLLQKALRDVKAGDVLLAHLGIHDRQDPWAPAVLEPLIVGLKARGLCFTNLREHPAYAPLLK